MLPIAKETEQYEEDLWVSNSAGKDIGVILSIRSGPAWKIKAVIGAEEQQRVFREIAIVHIPTPGQSGKIVTNIDINLQPHPASLCCIVCKGESLQNQVGTTSARGPRSKVGK